MRVDFAKLESYRRRRREHMCGALGAAGLTPLFRFHAKRINSNLKRTAQLAGVVSALYDGIQEHEVGRHAFEGISPLGGKALDARRIALSSGFGAFKEGAATSYESDGHYDSGHFAAYTCDATGACYNTAPNADTFQNFLRAYPDSVHGPAGAARVAVLAVAWGEERKWTDGALPRAVLTYQQALAGDTAAQQTVVRSVAYWHAAGYPALPVDVYGGVITGCDYNSSLDNHRGPSGRNPPVCGAVSVGGELLIEDPGANGSCPTTNRPTVALDANGALQIVPGGSGMQFSCLSNILAQTVGALRAMEACRGIPEPWWFKNAMGRARTQKPQWSSQCRRNFAPKPGACLWDEANKQYWDCMGTDTSVVGDLVSFFDDAWDAVKSAWEDLKTCMEEDWLKCLQTIARKAARYLGFPIGTLLSLVANVDKIWECVSNLFNRPFGESADCFKDLITSIISESVSWDEILIAANVLIGNVPGAVVAAAKLIVSYVRGHIVNPTVRLVLDIAVASQDLVGLILSSGADAFRTTAGWVLIGAAIITVAEPRAAASNDWRNALRVGNAINRNTSLIVKTINEPASIVTYVKEKYINPAQAMVTATIGKVANVASFSADFKGSGDAFEDTAYMLSGLGGVLFSLGDALDDIPFVSGIGEDFKNVGNLMKAGAVDVRKASRLIQEVGTVLITPPSQLATKVQAAIDRAVALGLSDPQAFLEEAERAYNEAKQAVTDLTGELTDWSLPSEIEQQERERRATQAVEVAYAAWRPGHTNCPRCGDVTRSTGGPDGGPRVAAYNGSAWDGAYDMRGSDGKSCAVSWFDALQAAGMPVDGIYGTCPPIPGTQQQQPPAQTQTSVPVRAQTLAPAAPAARTASLVALQPPVPPPAQPPPAQPPPSSTVGPAIVGGVIGAIFGGPVGAALGVGLFGAIAAAKKG